MSQQTSQPVGDSAPQGDAPVIDFDKFKPSRSYTAARKRKDFFMRVLIGGFQRPPKAPEPPERSEEAESSAPLLTLLASARQGMTAGEVAAHFGWSLEEARKALEQLFSTGALRKRSSRYRLKN